MSSPTTPSVSDLHRATLEASRLAVYRWIAPLAAERSVLVAGPGSADGAAVLAETAGHEVVRVDLATAGAGEPGLLAHADGAFQLVVAIESATGGDPALLDELMRVTAPDGLLLVSATDGGASRTIRESLVARFGQVIEARSRLLVGSGISACDVTDHGAGPGFEASVRSEVGDDEREPRFLLAGDPGPVELLPLVEFEEPTLTRRWIDICQTRREVIQNLGDRVHELEQRLAEREQLRGALWAAQQALGARIATSEDAVREAETEAAATFEGTVGWKLTAPLRRAGALGTRSLSRLRRRPRLAGSGDRERPDRTTGPAG